jgi:polysaccharide biosynthesis protein PslG
MHSAMSRIVARATTVLLLIAAMTVIGQRSVEAEAVTPPQDGYRFSVGAKGSFDAMAMHPYVYPNGLAIDDHNGWSDVERVRQLMVDNGDGAKKIWMTELGAPTSAPSAAGVSQDEQARQITDILSKAAKSGFSGPAFIFSIRDIDTADQDKDQNKFGALLTSDWQPKAAAGVLKR